MPQKLGAKERADPKEAGTHVTRRFAVYQAGDKEHKDDLVEIMYKIAARSS